MDLVLSEAWLVLGTFAYCIGSGFIPVMNAEVYLLAVSAASAPATVVPLILAAAFGQMVAKSVMYMGGRGILNLPARKKNAKMEATREKLQKSKAGSGGFIFLSASTGFPPFYVVSILAGTLKIPFLVFFLPGALGRILRFALFVLFPQLAKGIWS